MKLDITMRLFTLVRAIGYRPIAYAFLMMLLALTVAFADRLKTDHLDDERFFIYGAIFLLTILCSFFAGGFLEMYATDKSMPRLWEEYWKWARENPEEYKKLQDEDLL